MIVDAVLELKYLDRGFNMILPGFFALLICTGGALAEQFLWDAPSSASQKDDLDVSTLPKNTYIRLTKAESAKHPKPRSKSPNQRAATSLPAAFDSAKQWPKCTSIRTIRRQGLCNSCWAVTTASVISDRICISTGKDVFISENQLAGCTYPEKTPLIRCVGGGSNVPALEYAALKGLPTGGAYQSNEGCVPYSVPPERETIPITCATTCTNPKYGVTLPVDTANHTIDSYWAGAHTGIDLPQSQIDENVHQMQEDLYKNGPITAAIDVYPDFQKWKPEQGPYPGPPAGVGRIGGHAVRITGWGQTAQGKKYWIIANSWGTEWGKDGYYWIEMGKNIVGVEGDIGAPIVNVTTSKPCKTASFCEESFDQVVKMGYKDPKAATYLFQGECMQEIKRDAKTGKLSTVGSPMVIGRKIVNSPPPPITNYFVDNEDKLWLLNPSGQGGRYCAKVDGSTKYGCSLVSQPNTAIPYTITATGVTYKYESSRIYVGKTSEREDKGVDVRALFSEPSMPKVLQFLDIDGTQMYVFGKGPKGKPVIGIVSYPKDPQDPTAAFKWVTKPGLASKFLSC